MSYEDENVESTNITKLVEDTTNRLIKDFSGKDNISQVKVIDNMIAFMGASGGTGTSTLVANLASVFSKKNLTVLVVDLNIMYPILHCLMGVKQEIEKKDLVTFLLGKNQLGESIENKGNISIMYPNNRYVIDYINCDTSACSKNLIDSIGRVRHLFDVIMFDCPRQIEFDVVNAVLYNCDRIYSVWDEGIGCVSNIDRMKKNMAVTGVETFSKMKVILNKKTNIFYTKKIFDTLELEVIETLPFDTAVIESGLKGEIFYEKGASMSKNAAAFSKGLESLADKILEIGGYNK